MRSQEGKRAHIGDQTQILVDGAHDTGFLPRLSAGGLLGGAFVEFPPTLGEYPASGSGGLNHQDFGFIGGKGDDTGDETFAF